MHGWQPRILLPGFFVLALGCAIFRKARSFVAAQPPKVVATPRSATVGLPQATTWHEVYHRQRQPGGDPASTIRNLTLQAPGSEVVASRGRATGVLPSSRNKRIKELPAVLGGSYECFCGSTQLVQAPAKLLSNRYKVEVSTFWQAGRIDLTRVNKVSCDRSTLCDDSGDGYVISLRGYTTSDALRRLDDGGFNVHTSLKHEPSAARLRADVQREALKGELTNRLPPLGLTDASSKIRVASGMVGLRNGCVRVDTCRITSIGKMHFRAGQDRCSGFSDQTVANATHCLTEARGHNRMRCELRARSRQKRYPVLWTMSLGPYYSFQHFIIDKLPTILAAYRQLEANPKAKLLVFMDSRGFEILRYLNLDFRRFVLANMKTDFCADMLWVDAPVPGKYGNAESVNFPRPPELFLETAHAFQQRRKLRSSARQPLPRDRIVFLSRGQAAEKGKGHLANVDAVLRILAASSLNLVRLDASRVSIERLAETLSRARIVVGVHGGQMANIVFAPPDRKTAVLEIAGRQVKFKSYYYGGMSAAYDYHLLPRLCKGRDGGMVHLEDKKQGACRGPWLVDEASLKKVLKSLGVA